MKRFESKLDEDIMEDEGTDAPSVARHCAKKSTLPETLPRTSTHAGDKSALSRKTAA